MTRGLKRRAVLGGLAAAVAVGVLDGCTDGRVRPDLAVDREKLTLPRLRATPDRITAITVCTRPFRADGPRLDVERVGATTIVHNYGHGGSGWSLSWGSSGLAADKVLATGVRDVGVIGCGALGLTSALLLQRAGLRVTIYAKELPPNVRSSLATGVWTPDSRICFAERATPEFRERWELMARRSFQTYQTFLGLPGEPVEYIDNLFVRDDLVPHPHPERDADPRPKFAELQRTLLPDLLPNPDSFAPGSHPFGPRYVRRAPQLMFNLGAYQRMLMTDFLSDGGQVQIREFHSPADFSGLPHRTLVNATGYGARALFGDESVTPVRGQLARVVPEPDIHYGLIYHGVAFVPRRDGLVFQVLGGGDYFGFGDATTTPDRAEAEHAVSTIAGLFARG